MDNVYVMTLFVAGDEVNSRTATANVSTVCEPELAGRYRLEIIDVMQSIDVAVERGIVVTPTLLIRNSGNEVCLIGNLNDGAKLRRALGLSEQERNVQPH